MAGFLAVLLVGTSLASSARPVAAATGRPDAAPSSIETVRGSGDDAEARAALDDDRAVVRTEDGATYRIDGANTARGEGVLLEYTPDWGFTTGTNVWGAEAALDERPDGVPYRHRQLHPDRPVPQRQYRDPA